MLQLQLLRGVVLRGKEEPLEGLGLLALRAGTASKEPWLLALLLASVAQSGQLELRLDGSRMPRGAVRGKRGCKGIACCGVFKGKRWNVDRKLTHCPAFMREQMVLTQPKFLSSEFV